MSYRCVWDQPPHFLFDQASDDDDVVHRGAWIWPQSLDISLFSKLWLSLSVDHIEFQWYFQKRKTRTLGKTRTEQQNDIWLWKAKSRIRSKNSCQIGSQICCWIGCQIGYSALCFNVNVTIVRLSSSVSMIFPKIHSLIFSWV